MSVVQRLCGRKKQAARAAALAGSLLPALALGAPVRPVTNVTNVTVDGHPSPVTITIGETVIVRFDGKPNGLYVLMLRRDLRRTGMADPTAPSAASYDIQDGSSLDLDPAPGKVAMKIRFDAGTPAGPYVLHVYDFQDFRAAPADVPMTLVPQPQPQAIAGRVAVVSAAGPVGTPPPDAIVWAYSDPQTPAASADVQPGGSYMLPLPPGSYLIFAEWFGNLRSQRQVVTVAAGQPVANVDLPLLHAQEVSGTVRDDHGQPLANTPVQAVATEGATFTTQSLKDGSYLLALPAGQYTISARGASQAVTVADEPLDGVDFPAPAPGPAPAVGTIVTVAGNGILGLGGDGRPATAARLRAPVALALDRAGNLYIADSVNGRIRKVDGGTGLISTLAGSGAVEILHGLQPSGTGWGFSGDGRPAVAAKLSLPAGLAVDGSGNLYISDYDNDRVRKVDRNGIITTVAGKGEPLSSGDGGPARAAGVYAPVGLAVDPAGDLFIAEGGGGRVRKVGPDGTITTVAGGGKAAVTNGAAATSVQLSPSHLALDAAGNLYIGDTGRGQILKVSPAGTISVFAGTGHAGFSGDGGPATAARISGTLKMAADSAGSLFFGDSHRIRKIGPDGVITTVAGNGQYGFSADGVPATAAEIGQPEGLAIDAAGDLLFVDLMWPGPPVTLYVQQTGLVRKIVGIAAPGLVAGQ